MADPFEVRMRFTSQLQHLNASTTSAMKAANYALKYAEFSDDLFSCILEQLERTNMNLRANIMYFLPALCDSSRAQGEPAYVDMLERDIPRIIDLVAPGDGSGAANVKAVRRVLQQLLQKEFLTQDVVVELEEHVASRDSNAPASPRKGSNAVEERGGGDGGGGSGGGGGDVSGVPSVSRNTPVSTVREPAGFTTGIRLDKRQIEQRIEEDRERHKRAREGIWAVSQKGVTSMTEDNELGKLWDEVLDMTEDDRILGKEEMEERRACIEFEDV